MRRDSCMWAVVIKASQQKGALLGANVVKTR
jgi:hypothetical protein